MLTLCDTGLVRAYHDGKVEIHADDQRMMAKVILAHSKREQIFEMSVAELERYRSQAPARG